VSDPILEVRNLSVTFQVAEGKIDAVDDVSFSIPRGRTVALVGESGSGKSVISQTIMGILPRVAQVSGGNIIFRDPSPAKGAPAEADIVQLPPDSERMRAIRGGRISIIFQEPMTSLSPLHTIGDQIGEAHRLHMGSNAAEALRESRRMLEHVGFPDPEGALDRYSFELSGGLRQRAMIAMALVCRPALLIADEPTTALDVTIQAQIMKLIADLQDEFDMAVLMITHDLGIVANMAEEIVVLYHGRVMEAGTKDDIFRNPQHEYLRALLHAVPRFNMKPGERLQAIREIKPAIGGFMDEGPGLARAQPDGPLIEVKHLNKSFGQRKSGLFSGGTGVQMRAVNDVSFAIMPGECVGLVGESGCGKTTTSKMIMRAFSPDSGTVLFAGDDGVVDVHALDGEALKAYRRNVQFIFQDPFSSLNPRMTVFDILTEPLVIHGIGNEKVRGDLAQELMSLVGLDPRYLRRYPHSFSGGQRQRIGIARALALRPKLLICDEPVSALDVSVQAQVLNLLKDLQDKLGLTYLFISHNLAVVDYVANRILVMCRGRLVESAPRAVFFRNPQHPYTKALLAAVPKPDPDARMDLAMLMDGRASEPEMWPDPFALRADEEGVAMEVEPGHMVLYNSTQIGRETAIVAGGA
jgi:peptide/nickel transport system ATP-binding protein